MRITDARDVDRHIMHGCLFKLMHNGRQHNYRSYTRHGKTYIKYINNRDVEVHLGSVLRSGLNLNKKWLRSSKAHIMVLNRLMSAVKDHDQVPDTVWFAIVGRGASEAEARQIREDFLKTLTASEKSQLRKDEAYDKDYFYRIGMD